MQGAAVTKHNSPNTSCQRTVYGDFPLGPLPMDIILAADWPPALVLYEHFVGTVVVWRSPIPFAVLSRHQSARFLVEIDSTLWPQRSGASSNIRTFIQDPEHPARTAGAASWGVSRSSFLTELADNCKFHARNQPASIT
jgi:hypothetical protein